MSKTTHYIPTLRMTTPDFEMKVKSYQSDFIRKTGLSYQQWQQQWRFLKSIELSSQYEKALSVATALGFSSDSAFVCFFKKMAGLTPKAYIYGNRSCCYKPVDKNG